VTLLDVNILLYAYDRDAVHHLAAAQWVKHLIDGPEAIGLPWITLWAFVRLSTNPRVVANPKTAKEAFQIIREWLALPGVIVVQPGPRHAELLERLVIDGRAAGPLTTDAALAALAIEHGATLASTDRDFSRFPDLRLGKPDSVKPAVLTSSAESRPASSPPAAVACRLRK
jgi:toxin-antitoxin system PIN domain toxin